MSNALRRFAAAFSLELRLLCWNWMYPVLHLLWTGLLLYLFGNAGAGTAQSVLEGDIREMAFLAMSLVALFVAAVSVSRGQRTGFAQVERTLPTGPEVQLGRWLAALVGTMGAMVEVLAIAWYQGPVENFLAGVPIFLLEACILLGFSLALGWLVMDSLQGRRWAYAVLVGIWLLGFAGPSVLCFMLPRIIEYDEIWGRALNHDLMLWFDRIYLALTILLLAVLTCSILRRRTRRWSIPMLALAVIAGAGTWFSAQQYVAANTARSQALDIGQPDRVEDVFTSLPEQIEAYQMVVDLTNPAEPTYHVDLTVQNSGEEPIRTVNLLLNGSLTVTKLSDPYEREGHRLTVQLPEPLAPGDRLPLTLDYRGPVHTWFGEGNLLRQYCFTLKDAVYMDPSAYWYPLPAESDYTFGEGRGAAAVELQVVSPEGMTVASNLPQVAPGKFSGKSAPWVQLMASPNLAVAETGGVTFIAAQGNMPQLRAQAPSLKRVLAEVSHWFPDAKIESPRLKVVASRGYPAADLVDDEVVIYVRDAVLPFWAAEYEAVHSLTRLYWSQTVPPDPYGRDYGVDAVAAFISGVNGQDVPFLLARQLDQAYTQQGETAVRYLIRQMQLRYQEVDRLEVKDIEPWVQQMLQQMDSVRRTDWNQNHLVGGVNLLTAGRFPGQPAGNQLSPPEISATSGGVPFARAAAVWVMHQKTASGRLGGRGSYPGDGGVGPAMK